MSESQLKLDIAGHSSKKTARRPIPISDVDQLLTAQLIVAWAGECGEQSRLGWWRTDLVSEFGGKDLFQRLLPNTWKWAVFLAVREAARRRDAAQRNQSHNPDLVVSLFSVSYDIDERVEERIADLLRLEEEPLNALPGLSDVVSDNWNTRNFTDWIEGFGTCEYSQSPVGRWIKGEIPESLDQLVHRLIAGFDPISTEYPLPHFRRSV